MYTFVYVYVSKYIIGVYIKPALRHKTAKQTALTPRIGLLSHWLCLYMWIYTYSMYTYVYICSYVINVYIKCAHRHKTAKQTGQTQRIVAL